MKAALLMLIAACAGAQTRTVELPGKSPLVTFRIVFTTGSAADPAGQEGIAALTAQMISDSGTKALTYKQLTEALYPMAAGVGAQVDKEMTTFSGATHVDNLDAYYHLLHDLLLDPGWRPEDFRRVKDDLVNNIKVGLRGNNDEELGKEVIYETLYAGTPYGHFNGGTVSALEKLTLDDVKAFYKGHYTQSQLILGLAGGYSPAFLAKVKKDFSALPKEGAAAPKKTRGACADRHTHGDGGERYAERSLLDRLPHRSDPRASGLRGAPPGLDLPGRAPC